MLSRSESLELKKLFPGIEQKVHGRPLIYLDSAATSLKLKPVVEAMSSFDLTQAANVHRGVHYLSARATDLFEQTRDKTRRFLNAEAIEEIVFTSGTTEAINLVANSYGENLKRGDEILVAEMEHHSNFVPWQQLAFKTGLVFKTIPTRENGELEMSALEQMLSSKTKLIAVTYVSNVLGTINPIKKIISLAKKVGAKVLIDAAQAVPVFAVDVKDLDCDFFVFSAHKMYGPFGLGILYAKKSLLSSMSPWKFGGGMIDQVKLTGTTFADIPYRFESGTPNISAVIGFNVTLDFLKDFGYSKIEDHEKGLQKYAQDRLQEISGVRVFGTSKDKIAIESFNLDNYHAADVGSILDRQGVAVRAGHHCAQPLMHRFRVPGVVRASFSIYNTAEDVDALITGLNKAKELLG